MVSSKPVNIAILGAGSIGCYLGGCLAANSDATTTAISLIGRPRLQQQLQSHGLTVTDWQGRHSHIATNARHAALLQFHTTCEALAHADYILVTVKSGDTRAAGQLISRHGHTDAVVISFQNGVSNGDKLQQLLPRHTVLRGMVPFNVFSQGQGVFHCGTEGNLALQATTVEIGALLKRFASAALPIMQYDDMATVQWGKLVVNLNNAVNALAGMPLRDQLYHPVYRRIMARTIKEALVILTKAGIRPARSGKVIPALLPYVLALPTPLFAKVASAMLKIDADARSSMYEDLQLQRTTEVDFLNGEIVRLAKQHQLAAPINSTIVTLIKDAERQRQGSPMIGADSLRRLLKL
ncbi:2-dehydropantoate 2-reductase [Ferrimonas lipolytica]|uniref:2-dehydropantoate 2-reductase n=1 Tax=Ferrimonas lipolytica TaxID=2724191 RepID=A0A6H1UAP1_9GAMM|nr:2-dehydropantoate 2-reductase [Ferrimonas lipolytica]QIZ76104.1 2-dehydropantoate 2-reductase [Ferrimonas lipolytica]